MVLPGMNNWDRIFPEMSAAMINIRNFTLDGIANHALGSFTSTWGDNGSKNLRELLYYLVDSVLDQTAGGNPADHAPEPALLQLSPLVMR